MKKKYLILIVILLFSTACSKVDSVKKSKLDGCKDYNIGELIDKNLDKVNWTEDKDGKTFTIRGVGEFNYKKSKLEIVLVKDGKDVSIESLKVKNNIQDSSVYKEFVESMCKGVDISLLDSSDEKVRKSTFEKLAKDFYKKYYYEDNKEHLSEYEKIGIKVNLKTLEKIPEYKKETSKVLEKCNKNNTKATIYPKSPYGVDDYKIEINMSCK